MIESFSVGAVFRIVNEASPALREMLKQGARPFLVGAIGEVAIAGLTLGLVYGAVQVFNL